MEDLQKYVFMDFDSVDEIETTEKCRYAVAMYLINNRNTDFQNVEDMIDTMYVEEFLITLPEFMRDEVYNGSKYYMSFL
jgi:hypothetical protein